MSKPLLPDDLWAIVEPLLPAEPPKPKGGRPRVPARAALTGILFVLKSGIPWEMLPQTLLDRLGAADRIDWERASLDSASVPANRGVRRSDRTQPIAARWAPIGT